MHVCYRSLLALTPKPYMRSGQSERHVPAAPIRMPRSSYANQDAWAVLTPKRPEANSNTLRCPPHATSRSRLYQFQYKYLTPLFVFGQRALLSLSSTTSHFRLISWLWHVDEIHNYVKPTGHVCPEIFTSCYNYKMILTQPNFAYSIIHILAHTAKALFYKTQLFNARQSA